MLVVDVHGLVWCPVVGKPWEEVRGALRLAMRPILSQERTNFIFTTVFACFLWQALGFPLVVY